MLFRLALKQYILSILLFNVFYSSTYGQESKKKQFLVQLDSSISKITYQKDYIFSETTFESDKKIQILYNLNQDSLRKFEVTDSCFNEEVAFYNFDKLANNRFEGGISHTIIPCIAFSEEDMQEMMSEKYHYKQEHIKKFCLDLFDKIKIVKKKIFLD